MFQDSQIHIDYDISLCVLNFVAIEQTGIVKLILNTSYESQAPESKILSYKTPQKIDQLFGVVCYVEIHCELIVECLVYAGDLQCYYENNVVFSNIFA